MITRGVAFALKGSAAEAVESITSGHAASRTTGSSLWQPLVMSYLATAHAGLGQFAEAWRCIGEAISTTAMTKERWFEAEAYRVAGEIALKSPNRMLRRQKRISSVLSLSRESSTQNPGNSAPQ
jgi:hypothetical protein